MERIGNNPNKNDENANQSLLFFSCHWTKFIKLFLEILFTVPNFPELRMFGFTDKRHKPNKQ